MSFLFLLLRKTKAEIVGGWSDVVWAYREWTLSSQRWCHHGGVAIIDQ